MVSVYYTPTVFDASVKLPSGIEHGNVYQFGNFDECMAIDGGPHFDGHRRQSHPQQVIVNGGGDGDDDDAGATPMVRPMYCLAEVQASDYMVRMQANRHFQVRREHVQLTNAQLTPNLATRVFLSMGCIFVVLCGECALVIWCVYVVQIFIYDIYFGC